MSYHKSNSVDNSFQRTIESLRIGGKSKRTAETYAREVRVMGKWLDKPLDQATDEDLRRFVLYRLNECKLTGSSMRILICGLRQFFTVVLDHKWPILEQMKASREETLPLVLDRDQIWRILENATELCHRTYLQTVYTCGFRLSEALSLTIHDINGKRMRIHVRKGKGAKDRIVPLPEKTYLLLRQYWATHRNPLLIFPALGRGRTKAATATMPMPTPTVQWGLKSAVKAAGMSIPGIRMHTLRHCYATHLLEAGINVHAIQKYMGHSNLSTTLRYFHLTKMGQLDNEKILNGIMKDPKQEVKNV